MITIYAGMRISNGDLSPRGTGMGNKCPPQEFVGIAAENFFCRKDEDGEPKTRRGILRCHPYIYPYMLAGIKSYSYPYPCGHFYPSGNSYPLRRSQILIF
jgi:hypothetical protein